MVEERIRRIHVGPGRHRTTRQSMRKIKNQLKLTPKCEILKGIWPLLGIGRVFGMIHLRRSGHSQVAYCPKSIFTILSIIIWLTYVIFFIFAIMILIRQLKSSDTNLVEQFLDLIYHLHITLTLTFAVYQSKNFPALFEDWYTLETKLGRLESLVDFPCCNERGQAWQKGFKKVRVVNAFDAPSALAVAFGAIMKPFKRQIQATRPMRPESNFVLSSWIMIGGYFTLAIIGAVAYFAGIGVRTQSESIFVYLETAAEVYILKEYSNWWSGIFVVLIGHVMEVTWAYGDMLIFFFSYTLKYHFGQFNKMLEVIKLHNPSIRELELLRTSHWEIALGIKKTDECLGLITTTTFTSNILYLFARIYLGLAEDLSSPEPSIVFEAAYAFSYLIGRIFVSAWMASNLNQEANRTLNILMEFSEETKSEEHYLMMERFCNQVITGNVAFTGNGYFVLNRNFIASLVSVIATYEIIIVQFSSS